MQSVAHCKLEVDDRRNRKARQAIPDRPPVAVLEDRRSDECFPRIAITRSVDVERTVRAALHMQVRGRGGGQVDAHLGEYDVRGGWALETALVSARALALLTGQQFLCSLGEDQPAGIRPELSRFVQRGGQRWHQFSLQRLLVWRMSRPLSGSLERL